jgi:hypothetical protein
MVKINDLSYVTWLILLTSVHINTQYWSMSYHQVPSHKKKKKKTPVYEKQIKLENYWNNELIIR